MENGNNSGAQQNGSFFGGIQKRYFSILVLDFNGFNPTLTRRFCWKTLYLDYIFHVDLGKIYKKNIFLSMW